MQTIDQFIRRCGLCGLFTVAAIQAAYASSHDSIDFELANLNGNAFVKISDFDKRPVLINVWGSECPPCIKETPLLNAQSMNYPQVQFLGIATDDRAASIRFVTQFQLAYPQLQAPKEPSGLLRRLGDPHGALPFTVMLDSTHHICASKLGEVDITWIDNAVKKCSQ